MQPPTSTPYSTSVPAATFFFFQAEDGIRDYKVTGVQTCAFFKEEDGIRDYKVTGVQTCALPICRRPRRPSLPAAKWRWFPQYVSRRLPSSRGALRFR